MPSAHANAAPRTDRFTLRSWLACFAAAPHSADGGQIINPVKTYTSGIFGTSGITSRTPQQVGGLA